MILPLLLRFWPYIAMVCLAGALWLSVRHNGVLSAQVDAAVEIANNNALVAEQERKARLEADKIAEKYQKLAETRRKAFNQKRSEVAHAAPEMDGALAPVLRNTLNELPEPPNPKAGRDKTSSSAPSL